jgi:hypothetical protein
MLRRKGTLDLAYLLKRGQVMQELAILLLGLQPGDEMPSIAQLASRFEVGRGTVQAALDLLRAEAGLVTDARGPAASRLVACDAAGLWRAAGRQGLMLLLPFPYSRRVMGLATGLAEVLRRSPVAHSLAYMRGARSRIEALAAGRADLAVVSALAAAEALTAGESCEELLRLGPESYAAGQGWLVREDFAGWPAQVRVGSDAASTDQSRLPQLLLPAGVRAEFVDLPYLRMQSAVASGEVDAVVWPQDVLPAYPGLQLLPLGAEPPADAGQAVLLVRKGDRAARGLLGGAISAAAIAAVQHEVLQGLREPSE